MGVHGLWKLLEAAGKPVPLETLENKVLAVDVSIWLHQTMKGFQDSRGAPVPNAHLLGLFHRTCKLLYYRIKPVFVFDGGVPLLKKQTIAARNKNKKQASQNAAEAKERLLKNLAKRKAIRHILHGPTTSSEAHDTDSTSKDDMFSLPPIPAEGDNTESEEELEVRLHASMESSGSDDDSGPETKPSSQQLLGGLKLDLHTLDVHSEEFCSLPPDVRHDILSELKETRKQNSWGRLHEMPEESGDFSSFQLNRLIKRRNVQVSLEKAEKEMGGKVMRMSELQELMTAQGVNIIEDNAMLGNASQRIASDSATRYVLCKDPAAAAATTAVVADDDAAVAGSSHSSSTDKMQENNPLYNEQVEFIAQMAENMLQKLSKNKQENSFNNEKEEKPNNHQEDVAKAVLEKIFCEEISSPITNDSNSTTHKILSDNWSSDDDNDTVTFEGSVTANLPEGTSKVPLSDLNKSVMEDACVSETVSKGSKELLQSTSDKTSEDSDDDNVESSGSRKSSPSATDLVSQVSTNIPVKQSKANSVVKPKLSLEIIINPCDKPDDDMFADIFETVPKMEVSNNIGSQSRKVDACVGGRKALEIRIDPEGRADDDDIFADVFKPHVVNLQESQEKTPFTASIKSEILTDEPDVLEGSKAVLDSQPVEIRQIKKEQDDGLENLDTGGDDEYSSESDSGTDQSHTAKSAFLAQTPTLSELNEMEASLEAEQASLQKERGRQERLAASITDQMCAEAQELLQLFGVPYLVAPMEAEAQCAFLDAISLTEGSITDDSDIWLFGAKKVYKNFFNQKKHVLQFTSSNINQYFKLSREQLVQLALLVGSDYTTGIQGVGPVTALEVVAAFQSRIESDPIQSALKGLSQFRDWCNSGRPHKSNRIRLLDRKLKNVKFSEGFPSQAVVEAYLRPSVEDSQETFSWGSLDLPALREYARSKFGWTTSKTDEILLPVSKRWSARTTQRLIDSYFNMQPQLVEGLSKMSKRVQKAVALMDAEDSDAVDNPDSIASHTQKEKKPGKKPQHAAEGQETKPKKVRAKSALPLANNETGGKRDDANQSVRPRTTQEGVNKKETELPVRAPTVPRERSSTGVKRVGVKSVQTLDLKKIGENRPGPSAGLADIKTSQSTNKNHNQNSNRKIQLNANDGKKVSLNSCDKLKESDCQPSVSGLKNDAVAPGSFKDSPSSSQRSAAGSDNMNVSADLAALSEMNWEDDPWDVGMQAEETRPKMYFGGVRPNKPRKPAVRRVIAAAQASDTRGVQPGWATQERMESRTAWVDATHRKKEESIPQREQDLRAREEAKMRAIELVKASGVKQASRLLGKTTKRGRAKMRPKGKVLPEHNLSESSGSDD